MDLCCTERPKPHTRSKPKKHKSSSRRTATLPSKRDRSHDRFEGTKTGVKQRKVTANTPTTRKKTHQQQQQRMHCEEGHQSSFHQDIEEGTPLEVSTDTGNEINEGTGACNMMTRTPRQGGDKESTGSNNSSEPQPLDLKAIIREYIRRKEEAARMLSSEMKEEEREQLTLPVDGTVLEVSDVVQSGGDSLSSAETKQSVVSPPTATNVPPREHQHRKRCKPTDSDVLFGRGRAYRNHPGNKNLKQLVIQHQEEYDSARNRDDKTNLSWMIVLEIIGDGGRFLKRDKACDEGLWFEASEEEAREKVSHALRDWRNRAAAPTSPQKDPPASSKTAPPEIPVSAENEAVVFLSSLLQQRQALSPASRLAGK